jgi:hypothetical protein
MLVGKHKKAIAGKAESHTALVELTQSLDVDLVATWREDYKNAMQTRGESLRIFQVSLENGMHTVTTAVANHSQTVLQRPRWHRYDRN